MGRKNKREEYSGWMEPREGDESGKAGDEARVKAGEARADSGRGTERRLGTVGGATAAGAAGVGAGSAAGKTGADRKKLAEVLASAGVDAGRVAIEILYLLPEGFVREYERLFHDALTTGEEGRGRADEQKALLGKAVGKRTIRSGGETMGAAKAGKKAPDRIGGGFVVRNDERWGEKQRVDRELRKLARGMAGERTTGVVKCGSKAGRKETEETEAVGCGKWLEGNWKWCPYCGAGQETP